MVEENLCLYGLSGQHRCQTILILVNNCKAVFIDCQCFVPKHRERGFRQFQQALLIRLPQLLNWNLALAMQSLGILLAPFPQPLVKFIKRGNGWHWHKGVAPAVAHLILHILFFVSGGQITKFRLETVMQYKPSKTLSQFPLSTLQHLRYSRGEIVEFQFLRYASDVFEDPLQYLRLM